MKSGRFWNTFGTHQNPAWVQKRPEKLNTATFGYLWTARRHQKVVLEGAWKINRKFGQNLVGKRNPGKAKIMKKVFVLKHLRTFALF